MTAGSEGGNQFSISCSSKGERILSMRSSAAPTPLGYSWVSLRVGPFEIPTDAWTETVEDGRLKLTAPSFDMTLLKRLYRNWDFMASVVSSAARYGNAFLAKGFPAAIDKTRTACNWSTSDFPPDNGWGKPYPDAPPPYAKELVYVSDSSEQISAKAWSATNADGKAQLLVRLNENPSICKSRTGFDGTRFYVEQAGVRVSAVPGFHLSYSCSMKPVTLALQGYFDPSAPFVLKLVPFHWHSLTDFTYYMSSVSLP